MLMNMEIKIKKYREKIKKSADTLILVEWDNLREMMWSENCVISPGGIFWILTTSSCY